MYRICRHAEGLSPQITKKIGSANRKVPHLQRLRNLTIILVRKFADLRFAELICGLISLYLLRWY